MPIPDPAGTGINLSLFPVTLLEGIEQSKTNELNLLLFRPNRSLSPWRVTAFTGSGVSAKASVVYAKPEVVFGIHSDASQGQFIYVDPRTLKNETRINNDSVQLSQLGKYLVKVRDGEVSIIQSVSLQKRTNPGPITYLAKDKDTQLFALLGGRYDSRLTSGVLSGTISLNHTTPRNSETQTNRVRGGYAKIAHRVFDSTTEFLVDEKYSDLATGGQFYSHHIVGAGVQPQIILSPFTISPELKFEWSSVYRHTLNGGIKTAAKINPYYDISLEYKYYHTYPDLPSRYGYKAGWFELLPNPDLTTEQDHSFSFNHIFKTAPFQTSLSFFYLRALNRPALSNPANISTKMINISHAEMYGVVFDSTFSLYDFRFGAGGQVSSSRDLQTKKELTYKPKLQLNIFLEFSGIKNTVLAFENRWQAMRFLNLENTMSISPLSQLDFRLSYALFGGSGIFKILNILNQEGYVSEGFPVMGRSFWVGYQI